MRVGDIILNRWASEDNPIRYSVFLRWQSGSKRRASEAVCVAFVNGSIRTVRWDKYAVQHDSKYEVVGHIPILKILREGLNDAKRKMESVPSVSG